MGSNVSLKMNDGRKGFRSLEDQLSKTVRQSSSALCASDFMGGGADLEDLAALSTKNTHRMNPYALVAAHYRGLFDSEKCKADLVNLKSRVEPRF